MAGNNLGDAAAKPRDELGDSAEGESQKFVRAELLKPCTTLIV